MFGLFLPFLLSRRGRVGFWQRLREFRFHGGEVRLGREIGPLVRVVRMIVEFFAAVGITDVTPALAAHRVIALPVGRQHGPVPRALRFPQERHQALAVERGHGRQAAEFIERGKQIDQADRPGGAGLGAGDAGRHHEKRDARGALPKREFVQVVFLPEVPAVIRPEHDDGVVRRRTGSERIEQPTDQGIAIGDVRQIGLEEFAVFARLHHQLEIAAPVRSHALTAGRNVVEVVGLDRWRRDLVQGIQIEIFPRRVERQVRAIDARREEEGLGRRRGKKFGRPFDELAVAQARARELQLKQLATQAKLAQLNMLAAQLVMPPTADVLRRIAHCMPSDVWVNSLSYVDDDSLALKGSSFLEAGVFDFVRWLEQTPGFDNVALRGTKSGQSNAGPTVDFDVELNLVDPDAPAKEVARRE